MNQPFISTSLTNKMAYKLKFSGEAAGYIGELTMLYLHRKDMSPRAVRVYIIVKETLL